MYGWSSAAYAGTSNRRSIEMDGIDWSLLRSFLEPVARKLRRVQPHRCEPPRVCRRPIGLSYAAMWISSSMA